MIRRPPISTPFPSPPLFRSLAGHAQLGELPLHLAEQPLVDGQAGQQVDRKSTRLNSSHSSISYSLFFFNDPATPDIYPLPLPAALPISCRPRSTRRTAAASRRATTCRRPGGPAGRSEEHTSELQSQFHLLFPLFF